MRFGGLGVMALVPNVSGGYQDPVSVFLYSFGSLTSDKCKTLCMLGVSNLYCGLKPY